MRKVQYQYTVTERHVYLCHKTVKSDRRLTEDEARTVAAGRPRDGALVEDDTWDEFSHALGSGHTTVSCGPLCNGEEGA